MQVNTCTHITDRHKDAINQFSIENIRHEDFRLSEILLDRGGNC